MRLQRKTVLETLLEISSRIMVMTHVKGRKYQQRDIKCAGNQHLYREQGNNKDERPSTVRSGEKVRGRMFRGDARVREGSVPSIF